MSNSLFNFRDDEEREMFFVAIPVIALFAILGYWFIKGESPAPVDKDNTAIVIDSDSDGVADSLDRCINITGEVSNFGCPQKPRASKIASSEVRDNQHQCPPNASGSNLQGCAAVTATAMLTDESITDEQISDAPGEIETLVDTDADGFIDTEDRCPSESGSDAGCPADIDGDNIYDTDDQCPELFGTTENNGCPIDTDGDGTYDAEDACPSIAAASDNGCPADADSDGVPDDSDNCPNDAGAANNNGCPADEDNDGISDDNDQCPSQAGVEDNNGCPADADNDGVIDTEDKCPNTAGSADNAGCLAPPTDDADADGIPNIEDNCPGIAGDADNSGCPLDSDDDGVPDKLDRCPSEYGEIVDLGCPAVNDEDNIARIIDAAVNGVKFNSNSATLTAGSRTLLDDIVSLLKQYPDSRLEVHGHTDSSGPAAKNMQLSMQRARACASYIAEQGITIDRLIAYGYGESQPVANNSTGQGREANRRVEFKFNR